MNIFLESLQILANADSQAFAEAINDYGLRLVNTRSDIPPTEDTYIGLNSEQQAICEIANEHGLILEAMPPNINPKDSQIARIQITALQDMRQEIHRMQFRRHANPDYMAAIVDATKLITSKINRMIDEIVY